MLPSRASRKLSTTLAMGLALGGPAAGWAQSVSNGGGSLSTGSGRGTSPGVQPGSSPSSTSIGTGRPGSPVRESYGPGDLVPGVGGGGPSDAFIQPGAGGPTPFGPQAGTPLSPEEQDAVDARLLPDAIKVADPADRALALERVARVKIFTHRSGDKKLTEAHTAVLEAGNAAMLVTDPVVRDLRLLAIIRNCLTLANEFAREAVTDETYIASVDSKGKMTVKQRLDWLIQAENSRKLAADLATKMDSTNLRAEMLFRVVDNESQSSQDLAQEVLRAGSIRTDIQGAEETLNRMADRGLVFATQNAEKILKPVWRDKSLVAIAAAAANSEQYARGVQVAARIPQPEYRTDAYVRLAESQARRNRADEATRTYIAAAEAVAAIPLDDPRGILASVLIDSLISVGRFDDARASVVFYPDRERRVNALGVVAESQGMRRLDQEALAWIDREAAPEDRGKLRRRVTDGMLKAVENARTSPGAGADTRGYTSPTTPDSSPYRVSPGGGDLKPGKP